MTVSLLDAFSTYVFKNTLLLLLYVINKIVIIIIRRGKILLFILCTR